MMNNKVTLSFDEGVIRRSKKYAAENNISLSRLVEFLLNKAASPHYKTLEDIPVSDWVAEVSEGAVEYKHSKNKQKMKDEFYQSKK